MELQGLAPLLLVFDVPTSLRFYRDVLGFTVTATAMPPAPDDRHTWLMIEKNGIQLMMEPLYPEPQKPAAPVPERVSHHADTLLYFGCPDVDAAYHELRTKGVEVNEPVLTVYGYKAIYVKDPDGFRLVFHWPA